MPRSPTISRAMAPYVVSDVTTLTLSATGARTGGGVTGTCSAMSSAVSRSMSVGLVFVWSNRPNRLEGELVHGVAARRLGPGVLRLGRRAPREAEVDPADLGTQARVWLRTVQCRAAELRVGRARQLPEIEQMNEIGGPAAAPEQLAVARAPGQLCRQLVHAEPP